MKKVTIPVTINFKKDINSLIGTMTFDKDKVPENLIKNVHFEPTFKILEMEEKDGIKIIKKAELIEVSLVFDKKGKED